MQQLIPQYLTWEDDESSWSRLCDSFFFELRRSVGIKGTPAAPEGGSAAAGDVPEAAEAEPAGEADESDVPNGWGGRRVNPAAVAVLGSTDRDCEVVQANETSDLALSKSSGSLLANKLWRLPLSIFCKRDEYKY